MEGGKVEENLDVLFNIFNKIDMILDGLFIICDINSKRESNFKLGKKILYY